MNRAIAWSGHRAIGKQGQETQRRCAPLCAGGAPALQ